MITVEGLTKTYGGFTAVDDISFTAQTGRVTGFLGPNGAGKSTAMRIMVGLTEQDRGVCTIDGRRYRDIPNPARTVGSLLDASAQHGGRTGREVLTIGAKTMGLPLARVDEMLDLVGLNAEESKRRVRNYSLGMRQRLGIAHSLLGDPSVLILDEPANGLDPAGIRWMRSLLKSYADRGGTVLLSSHLLSEIEIIADELVVIGHGKIVAEGTKADLLNVAGVYARALDAAALKSALDAAGLEFVVDEAEGFVVQGEPEQVGRAALQAGVVLTELRKPDGAGLEDLFLELTADTQRDAVATEGAK